MEKWIDEIVNVVRDCGEILLHADRSAVGVDEKAGHANFVTTYDRMIQDILEEKLLKLLPGAVFVGEEKDINESIRTGYAFIVDPIDGTTNFICDGHASAISVGVTLDGEPFAGVICNPYLDEMYTAQKGCGAFLNGAPIHVSGKPLKSGLVLFGTAPYYEELNEKTFETAFFYFKKAADLRRSGSAAIDLCSIACGRAELFFELALSPWDYAAGMVMVQEAGGVITNLEGGAVSLEEKSSVLATNRRVRDEIS